MAQESYTSVVDELKSVLNQSDQQLGSYHKSDVIGKSYRILEDERKTNSVLDDLIQRKQSMEELREEIALGEVSAFDLPLVERLLGPGVYGCRDQTWPKVYSGVLSYGGVGSVAAGLYLQEKGATRRGALLFGGIAGSAFLLSVSEPIFALAGIRKHHLHRDIDLMEDVLTELYWNQG